MKKFKIFVNFKTYQEASGLKAVALARICQQLSNENQAVEIIPIVQALDVWRIKEEVGIAPWLQHLDGYQSGQATGWINLETALAAGAVGTLLNHSEHRIPPGTAKQVIKRTKAKKDVFKTAICVKTLGQVKKWSHFKADFLAFEAAELIGTNRSISREKPKAIRKALKICQKRGLDLLVGAGISTAEDVFLAKKMGAAGILVSSAVVLAENQTKKLEELVTGV